MSKKCGKIRFTTIISNLEKNRENIGILLILNLAKYYKSKFIDYGEDYFELIYGDPRIYMKNDEETLGHYINILEGEGREIITLQEIIQLFNERKLFEEEIFDKLEGLFKNASITSIEMQNEYIQEFTDFILDNKILDKIKKICFKKIKNKTMDNEVLVYEFNQFLESINIKKKKYLANYEDSSIKKKRKKITESNLESKLSDSKIIESLQSEIAILKKAHSEEIKEMITKFDKKLVQIIEKQQSEHTNELEEKTILVNKLLKENQTKYADIQILLNECKNLQDKFKKSNEEFSKLRANSKSTLVNGEKKFLLLQNKLELQISDVCSKLDDKFKMSLSTIQPFMDEREKMARDYLDSKIKVIEDDIKQNYENEKIILDQKVNTVKAEITLLETNSKSLIDKFEEIKTDIKRRVDSMNGWVADYFERMKSSILGNSIVID